LGDQAPRSGRQKRLIPRAEGSQDRRRTLKTGRTVGVGAEKIWQSGKKCESGKESGEGPSPFEKKKTEIRKNKQRRGGMKYSILGKRERGN